MVRRAESYFSGLGYQRYYNSGDLVALGYAQGDIIRIVGLTSCPGSAKDSLELACELAVHVPSLNAALGFDAKNWTLVPIRISLQWAEYYPAFKPEVPEIWLCRTEHEAEDAAQDISRRFNTYGNQFFDMFQTKSDVASKLRQAESVIAVVVIRASMMRRFSKT